MKHKTVITKEGLKDLKNELDTRKDKLKEIADKIDEARQQGDLSENAAYTTALSEKEMNEAKIKELEDKISGSIVVEADPLNPEVELGEKVLVRRSSDNKRLTYEIVGIEESNPSEGKISIGSPIGKALAHKKKGDKVKVKLPSGEEEFLIEEIA
ncbi:transcription elongation factor GreA [Candidatus Dojkabacteria bacterium]|nr:transcription elongation factor GreA [Candidatus Dojkabacteria bacterium]